MIVDQEYGLRGYSAILENFSGSQLARKSITLLFVSGKAIPVPSLRNAGNRCKIKKKYPNLQIIWELFWG